MPSVKGMWHKGMKMIGKASPSPPPRRRVQRQLGKRALPPTPDVLWQWEEGDLDIHDASCTEWKTYTLEQSATIDAAYNDMLDAAPTITPKEHIVDIMVSVGNSSHSTMYRIDLMQMVQTNMSTGASRAIQRLLPASHGSLKGRASHGPASADSGAGAGAGAAADDALYEAYDPDQSALYDGLKASEQLNFAAAAEGDDIYEPFDQSQPALYDALKASKQQYDELKQQWAASQSNGSNIVYATYAAPNLNDDASGSDTPDLIYLRGLKPMPLVV